MDNLFAGDVLPETQSLPRTNFPGWRYHPTGASRLVKSQEEMDRIGEGWKDVPYPPSAAGEFSAQSETSTPPKPCETCKKLVSENVAMTLRFDEAYGNLRQEHESLKGHHDLVVSQNVVLTQQLAQTQGKLDALAVLPQTEKPHTETAAAGADTPQPQPVSGKSKAK